MKNIVPASWQWNFRLNGKRIDCCNIKLQHLLLFYQQTVFFCDWNLFELISQLPKLRKSSPCFCTHAPPYQWWGFRASCWRASSLRAKQQKALTPSCRLTNDAFGAKAWPSRRDINSVLLNHDDDLLFSSCVTERVVRYYDGCGRRQKSVLRSRGCCCCCFVV